MDNEHKIQYASAVGLLASGVLLSFIAFFTSPDGEISSSVLWYFGECLIWAGSVFGITSYIDFRLKKFSDPDRKKFKDLEDFRGQ